MIKVSTLKKNPGNPRQIKGDKLEKLKASVGGFQKMMTLRPMIVDENNIVIGGNMRLASIKALGLTEIPDDWVKRADDLTADERAQFIITDNSSFGEYDWDAIANEWSDYPLSDWGLDVPGMDLTEIEDEEPEPPKVTLADRFLIPPFSVLDARQGYWQDRKRAWLALGIQSELGRGENLQGLSEANDVYRDDKNEYLARIGRGPLAKKNGASENGNAQRPESKTAKLSPGGSPRPAMKLINGKTVRGDGYGKELR